MAQRNEPDMAFFTKWIDVWVNWCTQNQMYCTLTIMGFNGKPGWPVDISLPHWMWEGIYPVPLNMTDNEVVIRDFFDLDVAKQEINYSAFKNLWKFTANRHKNNPYVMYGIMNEPFEGQVNVPNDDTQIHLGQTHSTFMEQMVDSIRSTGSSQKVIIDKPFLSANWKPTVKPVNRRNIIWEVHHYVMPFNPTIDQWKKYINKDIQLFINEFHKPLFIEEFGIDSFSEYRTICIKLAINTSQPGQIFRYNTARG
jgi:hypothetical protein